jgi:RHS repeat-associated protein
VADTLFYYDGDRVVAEFDNLDTPPSLLRYYVDGPTYVDEHLLMHDPNAGQDGEDHYYLLKELYTVAGLADESGAMIEAYDYDAYGAVAMYDGVNPPNPLAVSAMGNPYFFTGRRLDQLDDNDLELYHYRARAYDPTHGRFLQRDPGAGATPTYEAEKGISSFSGARRKMNLSPFSGHPSVTAGKPRSLVGGDFDGLAEGVDACFQLTADDGVGLRACVPMYRGRCRDHPSLMPDASRDRAFTGAG